VNLNRTAFDLFSQVSEVSTDVYLRNMTEIVDSIVTVHNRTCKTLANEIQTLKIRSVLLANQIKKLKIKSAIKVYHMQPEAIIETPSCNNS